MTFIVKANPTFEATLTIVGQGREQKLKLIYRHYTQTEYSDLLNRFMENGGTDADLVLELVEKWNANVDLDGAGLALLEDQQPGAVRAIIEGFSESLRVARRKN